VLARHVLEAFALVAHLSEFGGEVVGRELGPVVAAFGLYLPFRAPVDDVRAGNARLAGSGDDVFQLGAMDHQV